jgi:hypothetical protein
MRGFFDDVTWIILGVVFGVVGIVCVAAGDSPAKAWSGKALRSPP